MDGVDWRGPRDRVARTSSSSLADFLRAEKRDLPTPPRHVVPVEVSRLPSPASHLHWSCGSFQAASARGSERASDELGTKRGCAFWLLPWANWHLIVRLCYSPSGGCNNLLNAMHLHLGLAYALFFRSWLCELLALPRDGAQKHLLIRHHGTPRVL